MTIDGSCWLTVWAKRGAEVPYFVKSRGPSVRRLGRGDVLAARLRSDSIGCAAILGRWRHIRSIYSGIVCNVFSIVLPACKIDTGTPLAWIGHERSPVLALSQGMLGVEH
jgi:hypothetical protein